MATARLTGGCRSSLPGVTALLVTALLLCGCGSGQRAPRLAAAPGGTSTSAANLGPRSGIPARLLRQARPIGRGAAFHPALSGTLLGGCRRHVGPRFGVHLELFAANRVALIAAGIGTRPPRRDAGGRVVTAGCYGALITLDPTGVVRVRVGDHLTVADIFRSWGQSLSVDRLLSFHGRVAAFVDGRRWTRTSPMAIPLTRHAEIVLEVGPHVPPHRSYTFPPGT